MARVTVEDCILKVSNRFELVMLAAQRARAISSGAPLEVDRDNDKNPVVALREIADDKLDRETLSEALIRGRQKHLPMDDDEVEDDIIELMAGEEEMLARGIVAPEIEGEDLEAVEAAAAADDDDEELDEPFDTEGDDLETAGLDDDEDR